MSDEEFLSAMTMCRILPGANQVNMAVFVGTKMRGIPGAGAALFGLCLMPVVLSSSLAYAYFRFKEVPAMKSVLHGASAAAVALTLTMVIKTGQKCLTELFPIGAVPRRVRPQRRAAVAAAGDAGDPRAAEPACGRGRAGDARRRCQREDLSEPDDRCSAGCR